MSVGERELENSPMTLAYGWAVVGPEKCEPVMTARIYDGHHEAEHVKVATCAFAQK